MMGISTKGTRIAVKNHGDGVVLLGVLLVGIEVVVVVVGVGPGGATRYL